MKKPASGKFQLRLDPEIHARVRKAAASVGMSLNQWVALAVAQKLDRK